MGAESTYKEDSQDTPHLVSFMLASLYCGLWFILVYPNPQKLRLTWKLLSNGCISVVMSLLSGQGPNLCWLSLAFVKDWRLEVHFLFANMSHSCFSVVVITFTRSALAPTWQLRQDSSPPTQPPLHQQGRVPQGRQETRIGSPDTSKSMSTLGMLYEYEIQAV